MANLDERVIHDGGLGGNAGLASGGAGTLPFRRDAGKELEGNVRGDDGRLHDGHVKEWKETKKPWFKKVRWGLAVPTGLLAGYLFLTAVPATIDSLANKGNETRIRTILGLHDSESTEEGLKAFVLESLKESKLPNDVYQNLRVTFKGFDSFGGLRRKSCYESYIAGDHIYLFVPSEETSSDQAKLEWKRYLAHGLAHRLFSRQLSGNGKREADLIVYSYIEECKRIMNLRRTNWGLASQTVTQDNSFMLREGEPYLLLTRFGASEIFSLIVQDTHGPREDVNDSEQSRVGRKKKTDLVSGLLPKTFNELTLEQPIDVSYSSPLNFFRDFVNYHLILTNTYDFCSRDRQAEESYINNTCALPKRHVVPGRRAYPKKAN